MAFPLLALIPVIGGIIDKIIPDKNAASKAKDALAKLDLENEMQSALKQIDVNQQEAKHSNIFIAGWRPFVGWVCGLSFLYHFIVLPIIMTFAGLMGIDVMQIPVFDMSSLMTVLMGLLGLGGLRTYEKLRGVSK